MAKLSELMIEVKATELPIVQEMILGLHSANEVIKYYKGLLDFLDENIPSLECLIEAYDESLGEG